MITKKEIFKSLDPLLEMDRFLTWDSENHRILNSNNPDLKELATLYKDLSTKMFVSNFDVAKNSGLSLNNIVNGDIESYTEYDRLLVHHLTNGDSKTISSHSIFRDGEKLYLSLEITNPRCFLITNVIQGKLEELYRDDSTSIYHLTSDAAPNLEKIELTLTNIALTHLVKSKTHKVIARMSFLPYRIFK